MTTIKNLHNDMVSNSIAKTALILVGDFLGRKYNNSKLYDASFTTSTVNESGGNYIYGKTGGYTGRKVKTFK